MRPQIALVLLACGIASCGEPSKKLIDARTGELRWFQCVVDAQRTGIAIDPRLRKSDSERDNCYGIEIRVPAGFHTKDSRKASRPGRNAYGGLTVDVPRHLISNTRVPDVPPVFAQRVRVILKPIHTGAAFFRGDYLASPPLPHSRTEVFLLSLRGFWNVQDTHTEAHGFRVFETPKPEQRPNHGKRVYAPTSAYPDLFAHCELQVIDNRRRTWAPTCRVSTNYDGLFELEYQILLADIEKVRSFDLEFKRLLGDWLTARSTAAQPTPPR